MSQTIDNDQLTTLVTQLRDGGMRSAVDAHNALRRLEALTGDPAVSSRVMHPEHHFDHEPSVDELVGWLRSQTR